MGKTTKSTMYSRYDSMMRIASEGWRGEELMVAWRKRGAQFAAIGVGAISPSAPRAPKSQMATRTRNNSADRPTD